MDCAKRLSFGGKHRQPTCPRKFSYSLCPQPFCGAREAGKYRLEGRDYRFQDGDVALFRFNV